MADEPTKDIAVQDLCYYIRNYNILYRYSGQLLEILRNNIIVGNYPDKLKNDTNTLYVKTTDLYNTMREFYNDNCKQYFASYLPSRDIKSESKEIEKMLGKVLGELGYENVSEYIREFMNSENTSITESAKKSYSQNINEITKKIEKLTKG